MHRIRVASSGHRHLLYNSYSHTAIAPYHVHIDLLVIPVSWMHPRIRWSGPAEVPKAPDSTPRERERMGDRGQIPLDTTNLVWSLRAELIPVNWGAPPMQWIKPTCTRAVWCMASSMLIQ